MKRVRAAKIHILIMGHLRKKMPAMMGKQKAQEKLLANLQAEFGMVQREYHLPAGKESCLHQQQDLLSASLVLLLKVLPHPAAVTIHNLIFIFHVSAQWCAITCQVVQLQSTHGSWRYLCSSKQTCNHLLAGDFPDVVRYREIIQAYDITTFPKLKESMLKAIEDSLSVDIPSLVRQFDNPYA